MPELPEVETVRRGLNPFIAGRRIERVTIRDPRLRWPIPSNLPAFLQGRTVDRIDRRGKYLVFRFGGDGLLVHLGMSGRLWLLDAGTPAIKHDHVDIGLSGHGLLRFHDPRRFGCILPLCGDPSIHPLLADLGPEPFSPLFSGAYLHKLSRSRKLPIKAFLMDGRVVAGIGNIYATEALFVAGLRPTTAAGRLARHTYEMLADAVRGTLTRAIDLGGSTLRNFAGASGEAGYFQEGFMVYGRQGCPCRTCGAVIRRRIIAQRSSFFCPVCQH